MTWKEIKDKIEYEGAKNDDEISCIHISTTILEEIKVYKIENGLEIIDF